MRAREIYSELVRRHPSWLTRGLTRRGLNGEGPFWGEGVWGDGGYLEPTVEGEDLEPRDPVLGSMAIVFASWHRWWAWLRAQMEIQRAAGEWLDLHGVERGVVRLAGERDREYRVRIAAIPDKVIEEALRQAAIQVLGEGAEVEVFTLRYHQLWWGRRHWGREWRWGATVLMRPLGSDTPRRALYWGRGHWGDSHWGSFGISRGRQLLANPWCVALVLAPRMVVRVGSYYRRFHWGRAMWGGRGLDGNRYRALRHAMDATKAAGIEVQIWIEAEDV